MTARPRRLPGDAARSARLYELVKHHRFLCDACGEYHPLLEHSACLNRTAAAIAAKAREAITQRGRA